MTNEAGKPTIILKAWKNIREDFENSLQIRFSKSDEENAKDYLNKLKDLHKIANEEIKPSRGHEGHEVKRFISEISF